MDKCKFSVSLLVSTAVLSVFILAAPSKTFADPFVSLALLHEHINVTKQEKIDEFMENLEENAENADEAMDDLYQFSDHELSIAMEDAGIGPEEAGKEGEAGKEAKEEEEGEENVAYENKLAQTNIFFGGGLVLFIFIVGTFLAFFAKNIIRDIYLDVRRKVLIRMGKDPDDIYVHLSPLSTAVREDEPKEGNNRKRRYDPEEMEKKSRFLFGEVLTQFVNPYLSSKAINTILKKQERLNPKPLIGLMLAKGGHISDTEIDKTLALQEKYRNGS